MNNQSLCGTCEIRAACHNDESLTNATKERDWCKRGIVTFEEIGSTGITLEQIEAVKLCMEARRQHTCESFTTNSA